MDPVLQVAIASTSSFFIVSLIFAIIILVCKAKTRNHRNLDRPRTRHGNLSPISLGCSATYDPSLNELSMSELSAATANFSPSNIIGDGSFGIVYKATLSNGVTVAVKKLSQDAFQGFREFKAEMDTLGSLRHPNIVKILGYCASGQDRVLIYEFIEKGSLDQWLHDTDDTVSENQLSWEKRMKVVRSAADGVAYLHNLDKPIIHRDIKASNVLLDADFEAHLSDFGLARRIEGSNYSHVSTQVAGTMGYMPPEYRAGFTGASVKADVYSFGILMLEIATGKRPNLPVAWGGTEKMAMVDWAMKMLADCKVIEMVDPVLSREGLEEFEIAEFFKIASTCTRNHCRERPAMSKVVEMLNQMSKELSV